MTNSHEMIITMTTDNMTIDNMTIVDFLLDKETLILATLDTDYCRKIGPFENVLLLHHTEQEHKDRIARVMKLPFPTSIYRKGVEYSRNDEGQFHCGSKNPSFRAKTLGFYWGKDIHHVPDGMNRIVNDSLKNWPVEIVFNDLRMWHHEDLLNRKRGDALICESIQIRWNDSNSGFLGRENGPITVVIGSLTSKAKMGNLRDLDIENFFSTWVKPGSKARIPVYKVEKAIEEQGIEFNPLSLGSCFNDPSDEFCFWSEFM